MAKLRMKYITYIHNLPYYRRRWPKSVSDSTGGYVQGFFVKRIQADPADEIAIQEELLGLTKLYKQMVDVYLGKADADNRPHLLLASKGLHAGQGLQILTDEQIATLFPNYDKAWREAAREDRTEVLNPLAELEKQAIELLVDPYAKPPTFFQDVWKHYSDNFTGSERQLNKEQGIFDKFIEYGEGDDLLNQANVDSYLKAFVRTRARDIKASSVERQTTHVMKTLSLYIELHDLDITLTRPKIPSYADRDVKRKDPLVHIEQLQLMQLLPEQESWLQLYVLISLHCGLHPKEASTLERDSFDFTARPYVVFIKGTKTENRQRAVPLVYKAEEIRQLVESGALDKLTGRDPDVLGLAVKNLLVQINPDSSAYALRHTFAHNADSVFLNETAKAQLGGWGASKDKINSRMFQYGRGGRDSEERINALAQQLVSLFTHLP